MPDQPLGQARPLRRAGPHRNLRKIRQGFRWLRARGGWSPRTRVGQVQRMMRGVVAVQVRVAVSLVVSGSWGLLVVRVAVAL